MSAGLGVAAKARFYALGGDEEPAPLERLRFFCSLAMNGQDWMDVEPFFNDVQTLLTPNAALTGGEAVRVEGTVMQKGSE